MVEIFIISTHINLIWLTEIENSNIFTFVTQTIPLIEESRGKGNNNNN